jgi:hypothetical protein
MTQSVRIPSTSTVSLGQARINAGLALDAAGMGVEGLEIIQGLLRAARTLDDPRHLGSIVHAGAVIAELYLGPLHGMRDDAQQLADALADGGAA